MGSAVETVVYPGGENVFSIDLGPIAALNARKVEIAAVSKTTAAELMRAMEEGFSLAGRLHAKILLETARAQAALERRAAVVMLDIAPTLLREKGLTSKGNAGNAETRGAVLSTDVLHGQLKDCVSQLESLAVLMKINIRGFEMAFTAVKRAVDTNFQLPAMVPTDHTQAHREREQERRLTHVTPPRYQAAAEMPPPTGDYGIEIGDANY